MLLIRVHAAIVSILPAWGGVAWAETKELPDGDERKGENTRSTCRSRHTVTHPPCPPLNVRQRSFSSGTLPVVGSVTEPTA